MSEKLEDRKEYRWIKEYLSVNKWNLLRLYGAHAVGVGWKTNEGDITKNIAIIFYVDPQGSYSEISGKGIPPVIEYFIPELKRTIEIQTDIIESEPAEFE